MRVLFTLVFLIPVGFSGCVTSPVTGRKQLLLLSEQEELALGMQAYKEVLSKGKIVRSGPSVEQVKRVGTRIAAVTGKNYDWEFTVIDDPKVVNAFCLPGGKVVVYTGLLKLVSSDDELAVVMGHEIAHATLRHGGERVSQNLIMNLSLSAADLLVKTKDPKTKKLLLSALGVGAQVGILLPYSRTQESEADEVGLRYLWKAGYDPQAAVTFWEKMLKAGGSRPPEFLSTHPAPEARLARLRKLAAELKRGGPPG